MFRTIARVVFKYRKRHRISDNRVVYSLSDDSKRLLSDVWNSGEDDQVLEKDEKYSSLSLFLQKRENVPLHMKNCQR